MTDLLIISVHKQGMCQHSFHQGIGFLEECGQAGNVLKMQIMPSTTTMVRKFCAQKNSINSGPHNYPILQKFSTVEKVLLSTSCTEYFLYDK